MTGAEIRSISYEYIKPKDLHIQLVTYVKQGIKMTYLHWPKDCMEILVYAKTNFQTPPNLFPLSYYNSTV